MLTPSKNIILLILDQNSEKEEETEKEQKLTEN